MAGEQRPTTNHEISSEEGLGMVERLTRKHFGLSAEEFTRRWHEGELRADDHDYVVEIAMLLPLVSP